jgi:hypothetical protein
VGNELGLQSRFIQHIFNDILFDYFRLRRSFSEMLPTIFKEPPYPISTINIVTPYNAQRAFYLTIPRDLQVLIGLHYSMLPKGATVDSMQGHESDIVILDWANTYGDNPAFSMTIGERMSP